MTKKRKMHRGSGMHTVHALPPISRTVENLYLAGRAREAEARAAQRKLTPGVQLTRAQIDAGHVHWLHNLGWAPTLIAYALELKLTWVEGVYYYRNHVNINPIDPGEL